MFDLVDRVLRGYTRALDMLGGLFLAIMVVLVFGNVVLRYAFNIGFVNLLPLLLLVVFAILKFPPFLSILGSALFAGILAPFTQWEAVKSS